MKKKSLLLLLCLPLLALSACVNVGAKEKQYIGIISALDNEISLLTKEAKIEKEETIGGITYLVGSLKNKPVVISRAGIGKVRASSGVTTLLNSFNISNVIFTGVAGD